MIGTGMIAHDYFAGAGGWDVACELLGIHVIGYEIMEEARRTRAAAGLKTSEIIDVREVTTEPGAADIHIDSPPCQSFSMAGKGAGRRALDAVLAVVASYRDSRPMTYTEAAALTGDERTALVVEPLRLALEGRPMFIAWEQVPTVLPVWEACADVLRRRGYSAVTALLNAEQYGVPQTRKRAILIARRDGRQAHMPQPTRSRYYGRTPEKLDPGVHKWVSMAEALGWGMTERPYPTIACSRTSGVPDKEKVGGSQARKILYDELAAGRWLGPSDGTTLPHLRMTTMENSAVRPVTAPAPTIAFGRDANSARWVLRNNTSANACERSLDQLAGTLYFGQRLNGAAWHPELGDKQHEKSVRITTEQAAVLQSFPPAYPWQGSLTKQFLQIGNAIPPLLAHAILSTFFDAGPVITNHRTIGEWLEKPEQLSLFDAELFGGAS